MAVNGILLGQGQSNNNKTSTIIITQDQWIEDNNKYKADINSNFNEIGCFIIKPIDNISKYIQSETFLKEISGQNFIFYSTTKPLTDYQINILYLSDDCQKIINIFNNDNYEKSFIEETYLFPSNNMSFSNQNLKAHEGGASGILEITSTSIKLSTTQNLAYTWGGVQGISNDKIDFSLYNKLCIEFNFSFTSLTSNSAGNFFCRNHRRYKYRYL